MITPPRGLRPVSPRIPGSCVRPRRLPLPSSVQDAAGYIVYVAEATGPRFLLLRNARHHTWGFPKGKLENGEDARAGALRELREETAIAKIQPDADFAAESVYELKPRGGVERRRARDEARPLLPRARGDRDVHAQRRARRRRLDAPGGSPRDAPVRGPAPRLPRGARPRAQERRPRDDDRDRAPNETRGARRARSSSMRASR